MADPLSPLTGKADIAAIANSEPVCDRMYTPTNHFPATLGKINSGDRPFTPSEPVG
ncbi:hypothetical protein [Phormidium sp. CCY1219]|uniref:hypothetical protein n=1 Tax=Phormidium sp. CCY1219 TaxID=2886104 RepID=UPI002D1EC3CE|nr:hypothetical protein [Phormidium sp. CCY1219]MEB3826767.1 hypothetical protein [Phormidium sp. CCY1219]